MLETAVLDQEVVAAVAAPVIGFGGKKDRVAAEVAENAPADLDPVGEGPLAAADHEESTLPAIGEFAALDAEGVGVYHAFSSGYDVVGHVFTRGWSSAEMDAFEGEAAAVTDTDHVVPLASGIHHGRSGPRSRSNHGRLGD